MILFIGYCWLSHVSPFLRFSVSPFPVIFYARGRIMIVFVPKVWNTMIFWYALVNSHTKSRQVPNGQLITQESEAKSSCQLDVGTRGGGGGGGGGGGWKNRVKRKKHFEVKIRQMER